MYLLACRACALVGCLMVVHMAVCSMEMHLLREDVLRGRDEFLSVLSHTGLDAEFLGRQQDMLSRHGPQTYAPGGHCCHVPGSFGHSLSCSLQPTHLPSFLRTVTQQHQEAQVTCHRGDRLLHRRSPDQPVSQLSSLSFRFFSASMISL
ncbi:hypothetical protein EYF80_027990 [Liparis tanakae]|uniref:Secreted protein n=1 Tax=Liparis tanakae TaxID=230148 RepID=A0A4Z2H760_9TELE|nr:hypothetical protein EYF80_027990 [Liparis tanakae]